MSPGFLRLKINHLMLLGEQNSLLLTVPLPLPQTIIHPPDFENKNINCPAWWNLSVPT